MPIYEYRCDDCGRVFEALQRIGDEPLDTCRHCSGSAKRIISSPAIHFVGSGWYVTDYARKNGGDRDGGKDGADRKDAPAEHKSETKSDSTGKSSGKDAAGRKTSSGSSAGSSSAGGEARTGAPS